MREVSFKEVVEPRYFRIGHDKK